MVESDFRDSTTRHHGKHHRNTRRDISSDDGNSNVPEPTRRDGEHNQHKEENPRKERNTKMTRRMARNLSSFAVLFTLILAAPVDGFAAKDRDFRDDTNRASFKAQDFNADGVRFSRGDV